MQILSYDSMKKLTKYCNYQCSVHFTALMHHGVTSEPCRILLALIHAKDNSVLEAEEAQFAPCLSLFLFAYWTF